jgi:hypothetical protein
VCQPDGSLIFHGLLPMQSFSREKPDIDCIWQWCRTWSFSGVSRRRRVRILAYCQTIPPHRHWENVCNALAWPFSSIKIITDPYLLIYNWNLAIPYIFGMQ